MNNLTYNQWATIYQELILDNESYSGMENFCKSQNILENVYAEYYERYVEEKVVREKLEDDEIYPMGRSIEYFASAINVSGLSLDEAREKVLMESRR